jgi:hypothetical protein
MAFSSVDTLQAERPHFQDGHATNSSKMKSSSMKRGISSIKERTVVVFDWDDTLCPSSWLHSHDLLPKYRGHTLEIKQEQSQILEVIATNVARLLRKAVSYGPVFVVTAAEYGWVELSCSLYLPSIKSLLDSPDIHIVSARSWYEQTFGIGGDSSSWKHEVMQLIARKCFSNVTKALSFEDSLESYFNFLSIGDSMAERDACHSAVGHVPFTFAKTLKFIEQPTSEEILQQVELTHDSLEQMCGWASNLDLRLTRSQLEELRCAAG